MTNKLRKRRRTVVEHSGGRKDDVKEARSADLQQTVDNDPAKPVLRVRPLCAYPKVAQWDGKGDRNAAEHWLCKAPAKAA